MATSSSHGDKKHVGLDMTKEELVKQVQEVLDTKWPLVILTDKKGAVREVRNGFGIEWASWRKALQAAGIPCAPRVREHGKIVGSKITGMLFDVLRDHFRGEEKKRPRGIRTVEEVLMSMDETATQPVKSLYERGDVVTLMGIPGPSMLVSEILAPDPEGPDEDMTVICTWALGAELRQVQSTAFPEGILELVMPAALVKANSAERSKQARALDRGASSR